MPHSDPEERRRYHRAYAKMRNDKRRLKKYGNLDDHRGRHGNHARVDSHAKWNEEGRIFDRGYVKIRVGKNHPLADAAGYAREQLIVWVSAGKPTPEANEELHHKNEVKSDNRIENIELLTKAGHAAVHIANRRRDEKGRLLPKGINYDAASPSADDVK